MRSRSTAEAAVGRAVQRWRRAMQPWRAAGLSGKERRRQLLRRGTVGDLERKFRELRALVPGGESLRADQLFQRTACYILHLRTQVHLLQALSQLYGGAP
ncbi:hypothetical protein Taro_010626 [Colocasia esculenta]|uniref:Uncharacterized protein n=1 Tax=Colocasia esculenta TaxID=4460 RepID=A0A843TZI4_COLES|nr:hypothetical protein [Colocasia esculenta]